MNQRYLELTIMIPENNESGEFSITVYEPESGLANRIGFEYSPDEHPEFNEKIGEEIYSWISLWVDMVNEENKGE